MGEILKIVHIITRLVVGGAQENTLITCELLARRGHDVTLITGPSEGPEGELLEQTKEPSYKVVMIDKLIRSICPVYDTAGYLQIKKELRRLRPDVVHTHSAKAGILGRFAGYGLKGEWGQDLPAVVHTIHGLAFHPYQSGWLNKLYIGVEKAAGKRTDYFISVADAMTEQARAVGIGKDKEFVTAYSAIEEDDFLREISEQERREFREKYGIPWYRGLASKEYSEKQSVISKNNFKDGKLPILCNKDNLEKGRLKCMANPRKLCMAVEELHGKNYLNLPTTRKRPEYYI